MRARPRAARASSAHYTLACARSDVRFPHDSMAASAQIPICSARATRRSSHVAHSCDAAMTGRCLRERRRRDAPTRSACRTDRRGASSATCLMVPARVTCARRSSVPELDARPQFVSEDLLFLSGRARPHRRKAVHGPRDGACRRSVREAPLSRFACRSLPLANRQSGKSRVKVTCSWGRPRHSGVRYSAVSFATVSQHSPNIRAEPRFPRPRPHGLAKQSSSALGPAGGRSRQPRALHTCPHRLLPKCLGCCLSDGILSPS
jgi:hypothetical protein